MEEEVLETPQSSEGGQKKGLSLSQADRVQQKSVVEALLFVAAEPVTLSSLAKVTELPEAQVKSLIAELTADYRNRDAGIVVMEVADTYHMASNPDAGGWVKRFKNISITAKLSQPGLETLSIIAYKQPITKLEIDQLRGVNSEGALRGLLEKRLVKIVGKKEAPGRPFLYGTTREFLQYFGLKSLGEMPPLSEVFKDEAA